MYKNSSVGVVFPALNEEENITNAIKTFLDTEYVDEVLVIDNGSTDSTKSKILESNARYIFEPRIGYGQACITGLSNCNTDLVFLVEPDGTFSANDLEKFLSYSEQFDVVFGSRTSSALIWKKAYMPNWVRFGNWVCAKIIELLFDGPSLSDVGCTFKLLKREAIILIIQDLYVTQSHFSPHLMIECLKRKLKCIEISINYFPRTGVSKITGGNTIKTIKLGFVMLFFILYSRLNFLDFDNDKRNSKRS